MNSFLSEKILKFMNWKSVVEKELANKIFKLLVGGVLKFISISKIFTLLLSQELSLYFIYVFVHI